MRKLIITTGFLILAPGEASGVGDPTAIDPVWRAKATSEGRAAWDRYHAASGHLQEEAELQAQLPPEAKGVKNRTILTRTARDGKRSLFERSAPLDGDSAKTKKTVECVNEHYRFAVTQVDPTSPFVMTSYATSGPSEVPPGIGFHEYGYDMIKSLLDAIDGRDGWTLTGLGWDAKAQLVRANLTQKDKTGAGPSVAHEIWFDPANQWRIVERKQSIPPTLHVRMTYGQSVDDLSYPVKLEQTTVRHGGRAPQNYTAVITLKVRKANRPESDYRLSGYGLPEPVDVPPPSSRRVPNYVWFLAGAAALVVLSLIFRWLAKRRSRVASTTPTLTA
jgi:hypothetical protein